MRTIARVTKGKGYKVCTRQRGRVTRANDPNGIRESAGKKEDMHNC